MRRRILFVGMQSSIHVARWIDLIARKGWDLHMFGVRNDDPNANLSTVKIH